MIWSDIQDEPDSHLDCCFMAMDEPDADISVSERTLKNLRLQKMPPEVSLIKR